MPDDRYGAWLSANGTQFNQVMWDVVVERTNGEGRRRLATRILLGRIVGIRRWHWVGATSAVDGDLVASGCVARVSAVRRRMGATAIIHFSSDDHDTLVRVAEA